MRLNEQIAIKERSKKRLGRGLGSGKGKTGGRGSKGQKARGKIKPGFVGSNFPLYKVLPKKRGEGNPKLSVDLRPINLSDLSKFTSKSVVDLESLVKLGVITEEDVKKGVKLLGNGEIKIALMVKLPVSESAKVKIENAGGKVENV